MSVLGQGLLDDIMPGIATDLINTFGSTATLIYAGSSSYNAATGVDTIGAATEVAVSASPPVPYDINTVDNTSIQQGDLKTLIPAEQVTATIIPQSSKLRIDSIDYLIVNIYPIKSGNDVAAYELQIRA